MKKIPKQEYTAEFKEQAVKRAQEVGIGLQRAGAGSGRADAAQLVKGCATGKPRQPAPNR